MGIEIDRDVCAGAGQCTRNVPDVFDQDDDDGLVVLLRQPAPEEEAVVRRAVSLCPSRALRLVAD
ncbi:ferredoxin [Streptacidiphilus sp. P02-A3a]|uniref:ferredoxin n=1 Tax=Streptacidiphilus sp. P02-A3a TaxID=2704468 RepID=UPI0015F8384F|nr:ferredoxin [Streptacidiphilus sp. P02-A3a]QMU71586.1 ferredoxin [Streptacidiphilus sp. P02-A3a]